MKQIVIQVLLAMFVTVANAQIQEQQIVGDWLGPKKDSKVYIYKDGNTYSGRITWGTGKQKKDDKNPNASLRNRDLIGLVILTGFVYKGNGEWTDGEIYDPREGKTYSCKMKLIDAKTLEIRGYIGISLFGRTERWTK